MMNGDRIGKDPNIGGKAAFLQHKNMEFTFFFKESERAEIKGTEKVFSSHSEHEFSIS